MLYKEDRWHTNKSSTRDVDDFLLARTSRCKSKFECDNEDNFKKKYEHKFWIPVALRSLIKFHYGNSFVNTEGVEFKDREENVRHLYRNVVMLVTTDVLERGIHVPN